MQTLTMAM
jgi:UDP-glucose 4-epimerase